MVLNDIINQTAVTSGSSVVDQGCNLSVENPSSETQPRNSLQSVGSNLAVSSAAARLERARRESRKISMMLDDEEDEGPRLKEKITEACQQFIDIFCVWDCCSVYIKLSEVSKHHPSNQPLCTIKPPWLWASALYTLTAQCTYSCVLMPFLCVLPILPITSFGYTYWYSDIPKPFETYQHNIQIFDRESLSSYFSTCFILQYLSFIIFDPFVDLFVTLCIVVNTLFMALDHHDMDPNINETLQNGNYVCVIKIFITFFFTVSFAWASLAWFDRKYQSCFFKRERCIRPLYITFIFLSLSKIVSFVNNGLNYLVWRWYILKRFQTCFF